MVCFQYLNRGIVKRFSVAAVSIYCRHVTPGYSAEIRVVSAVFTIHTSGESFMDDLHDSFSNMSGDYVVTCPSDLPLLTTEVVNTFIEYFHPGTMQSAIAVVDEDTVRRTGITPSYTRESGGRNWVLSGLSIMDRLGTLRGDYLEEYLFETNWVELSVNMNTPSELSLARSFFKEWKPCEGEELNIDEISGR